MVRPNLLITGVSGLIGNILLNALRDSYEIYGLDKKPTESCPNFFNTDITDFEAVKVVFQNLSDLRFVVHLAGDPREDADWETVWKDNIHGTWNVYAAAQEHGNVRRIVFASSNHVTGAYEWDWLNMRDAGEKLTATDLIRPNGPYGISKQTGEAIARYYYDRYGLESVCLRIGTVNPDPGLPTIERHLGSWLSHDDLVTLVKRALDADEDFPGFGIYYGVSDNRHRFWDLSDATMELGYQPNDNASDFWPPADAQ